MTELPRRQKQLHDLLLGRGDVLIVDMFTQMQGHHYLNDGPEIARMQRWLSPYITALNRKIVDQGLRVEPGAVKNSYRLVATP